MNASRWANACIFASQKGDHCDGEQLECCVGLQCCGVNGGSTCQECCANSDCDDPCEICVEGECVGACSQSQECCDDECVAIGTCCQESGDACAVTDGPGTQGNCCDDLLCCPVSSGYCAECVSRTASCPSANCCDTSDCCDACALLLLRIAMQSATAMLSQSECCCDGECVDDDDGCCNPEGSICGVVPSDDSEQLDCCDGLVCCDNLYYGISVCAECCVDADCPHGGHCHEGECKYPHTCKDDKQCPKGTCCCKDGSCSGKCCDKPHPPKPPKPPKPAPSGSTPSTLPATGAGPSDERNNLLGITALGAAAALYAAKKMRDEQGISEAPTEE